MYHYHAMLPSGRIIRHTHGAGSEVRHMGEGLRGYGRTKAEIEAELVGMILRAPTRWRNRCQLDIMWYHQHGIMREQISPWRRYSSTVSDSEEAAHA